MPKYSLYSKGELNIQYVVSDLNGTLAKDGDMIEGVAKCFKNLNNIGIKPYVLTGDIHGTAAKMLKEYECDIHVVDIEEKTKKQDIQKLEFIKNLGANQVCAIGNGANDTLMLEHAAIGILTIGPEGGSTIALQKSDIVTTSIIDALELLIHPKRIAGH